MQTVNTRYRNQHPAWISRTYYHIFRSKRIVTGAGRTVKNVVTLAWHVLHTRRYAYDRSDVAKNGYPGRKILIYNILDNVHGPLPPDQGQISTAPSSTPTDHTYTAGERRQTHGRHGLTLIPKRFATKVFLKRHGHPEQGSPAVDPERAHHTTDRMQPSQWLRGHCACL